MSQVLRSPGRVERHCAAQPAGEDSVLVQQEVAAGHGCFVWLNLMRIQLQHSRCWPPRRRAGLV